MATPGAPSLVARATAAPDKHETVSEKVSRFQPEMDGRPGNDGNLNLAGDHPVGERAAVRFREPDVYVGVRAEIIGQHPGQNSLEQGGRHAYVNVGSDIARHVEHPLLGNADCLYNVGAAGIEMSAGDCRSYPPRLSI